MYMYMRVHTCIHASAHSYARACKKKKKKKNQRSSQTINWGCRIHQVLPCRGIKPHSKCPVHETKQSDGEDPVMLELWGMQSTPSLPSLPVPLWSRVVAPDMVLSMGQIELNFVLMLNWIVWNKTVLIFELHTYAKLNCLN